VSPSKVAIRARPPNFDTKFRTRRSKWRISSRTSPSFSLVGKPNSFSDSAEKHKISSSCIQTIGLAGAPQLTASDTWRVLLNAIPLTFRERVPTVLYYTLSRVEKFLFGQHFPCGISGREGERREIEIADIWPLLLRRLVHAHRPGSGGINK